jgi:hypothetical protein
MTRLTLTICTWWISMAGIVAAQAPSVMAPRGDVKAPPVKSVAVPPKANVEILPPVLPAPAPLAPPALSPGEALTPREVRSHEQYLLQSQAQAESVHRAAVARAEQRTRRLESQRWFGMSNTRPSASVDPYDGDYSPGWVSNYPFYPYRWIGSGEPWAYTEGQ